MRVTRVDGEWRFSSELDSTGIYLVYTDEAWIDGYGVRPQIAETFSVPLPMRQRWAQLHPRDLDPGWFIVRGTGPHGPATVFMTLPEHQKWEAAVLRGEYSSRRQEAAVAL